MADDNELSRLQAEIAPLHEQADRLSRTLGESQRLAHIGSWEWDLRSGEAFWSDEMYRLYGYEPGDLRVDQSTSMTHTHPDDQERRARWIERMHEDPGQYVQEPLRLALPDGGARPILARGKLKLDTAGRPLRYLGTNQDLLVEARSSQTERLLSQIVTSTHEANYTLDRALRVLSWNPAAERLYGYTAAEIIGQSLQLLYPEGHGHSWDRCAEQWERLLDGETEFAEYEVVRRRKDGSLVHAAAATSPLRDHTGQIIGLVGALRDVTERRRTEAQLAYLATHDPLTGLFNRARLEQELSSVDTRARRHGYEAGLLMLNIDNFKYINETYGHKAGDQLVVSIASALQSRLQPIDVLARFGGDSFAVIAVNRLPEQVAGLAEELLAVVREHEMAIDGRPIRVTASVGVGAMMFDGVHSSVEEVLADADRAMYQSKENGRNRATVLTSADRDWVRDHLRRSTEHVIREALAHDHFELFVQPIVELRTATMT